MAIRVSVSPKDEYEMVCITNEGEIPAGDLFEPESDGSFIVGGDSVVDLTMANRGGAVVGGEWQVLGHKYFGGRVNDFRVGLAKPIIDFQVGSGKVVMEAVGVLHSQQASSMRNKEALN